MPKPGRRRVEKAACRSNSSASSERVGRSHDGTRVLAGGFQAAGREQYDHRIVDDLPPREDHVDEAPSGLRMHADEIDVDVALVRRLLAEQFPKWERLPLEPVLPLGTDNSNFRL